MKDGWYDSNILFVENGCEKESEFDKNIKTAKFLVSKWQKEVRFILPYSRNKYNYDAEIDRCKYEFKHPLSSNFGTLDSQIR